MAFKEFLNRDTGCCEAEVLKVLDSYWREREREGKNVRANIRIGIVFELRACFAL